jgi:hypothetical protein
MDKLVKYGSYVLLGVFVVWFFFNQGKQQEKLRKKMAEIEEGRKKIEDKVNELKSNTDSSEIRLQNILIRNNQIIDNLDGELRKKIKISDKINRQIDSATIAIDSFFN